MQNKNPHTGSKFNEFLKEQEIYEECETAAIKKFISMKLKKAMNVEKVNKSEMARRMKTSRSAVDRLLNPSNYSVNLKTLEKAAGAVNRKLVLNLEVLKEKRRKK